MQPKVSMVMPCYNKEAYIGDMFDSVLAQKWDNIELILVNDGSTDGTRRIIAAYEPKFRARGFEVIIVDQENRGLPGAVYSGFKLITGDYVCQVDADDELHPEYVSAMAGWLEEHPEDQWVVCDYFSVREKGKPVQISWFREAAAINARRNQTTQIDRYPYDLFNSFLLRRLTPFACLALVRTRYLSACGVLDGYVIEPRVVQEPQLFIPLYFGGKGPRILNIPLYYYHTRPNSEITSLNTFAKWRRLANGYSTIIENILRSKRYEGHYDDAMLKASRLILESGGAFKSGGGEEADIAQKLAAVAREYYGDNAKLNADRANISGVAPLARYFGNRKLGHTAPYTDIARNGNGRIIAYAAYGLAALQIKTGLLNSNICPDVFWDIAADGDSIKGIPVVKPDFMTLGADDVVLILLMGHSAKDIYERVLATPACDNVWFFYEILDYLAEYYYGEGNET